MPDAKQIGLNALAQVLGKASTVVASLLIVKIITGFGREFYGSYLNAYEYLAFFGVIADAGLFAIAVRQMSQTPEHEEMILGNILTLRLVFLVCVLLLAGVSAQWVYAESELISRGIWITGISMSLTIVAGTLSAVLQRRMKIQYFSGALALSKVLLAGLVFWISGCGVWPLECAGGATAETFYALLWAGVVINVVLVGLVYAAVRRYVRIWPQWNGEFCRQILRESLPFGLALVLQTLYLRLDTILIYRVLGEGASGTYGVAVRVLESCLVVGVFFAQAMLPRMSGDEADDAALGATITWGVEKLLLLALPLVVGAVVYAEEIVLVLANETYLTQGGQPGAEVMLRVLIVTVVLAYLNQLFTYSLVARGRQRFLLGVNAAALAANAGLNVWLLPQYGLLAAAGSTVLCELLVLGLLWRTLAPTVSWRWSRRAWGAMLVGCVAIGGLYTLTPLRENLLLAVGLGPIVYGGIVYALVPRSWWLLPERSPTLG